MTAGRRFGTVVVLLAGVLLAHSATARAQQPPGIQIGPHINTGLSAPADEHNSCVGGEIYDDGVPENGYSGNAGTVSTYEVVQRFNPSSLARTYVRACVNLIALEGTDLNFDIVVYSDNAGQPGTLLSATPVSAAAIPNGLPGGWYSFDVTGVAGFTTSAPVFVGARYNPMSFPSRFVAADESVATTLNPSFVNFNLGTGWETAQSVFPSYRAMLIRVSTVVPVPTLTEVAFIATLVLLLAAAFFSLRRRNDTVLQS